MVNAPKMARVVDGYIVSPSGEHIICKADGCPPGPTEHEINKELVRLIRKEAETDPGLAATLKPIDLKHTQRIIKVGFNDIVDAASGIEQLELAAVVKSNEDGITHELAMSEILKTEKGRKAWAEWEAKGRI
jgi:hypothetical protein